LDVKLPQMTELDPRQEKAFDMAMSAAEDLIGSIKLVFALSTGAVVLFVHLLVEGHISRWLAALVACSAICFRLASVQTIFALLSISSFKASAASALVTKSIERSGDALLKNAADIINSLKARTSSMQTWFSGGVLFALAFVVGLLVRSFRS
jgi:hypothetical protein